MLTDPDTGAPLASSERLLFSRFLASQDWRTIRLRPRKRLRALLAIAAPTNLADFHLADIDAAGEISRIRSGLDGADTTIADSPPRSPSKASSTACAAASTSCTWSATARSPAPEDSPKPSTASGVPPKPTTPWNRSPIREPSIDHPVIYHVFGVKDWLVLTEDDFLDYLIASSTYKLGSPRLPLRSRPK